MWFEFNHIRKEDVLDRARGSRTLEGGGVEGMDGWMDQAKPSGAERRGMGFRV